MRQLQLRWSAVISAVVVLASGCDRLRAQPQPVRQARADEFCSGELRTINDAERAAWNLKPEHLELLPRGASTLVFPIASDDGVIGIGFPISRSSAAFTLHSLQRHARRLSVTPKPQVVLLPGPPDSGQACVTLLTQATGVGIVLSVGDFSRSGRGVESLEGVLDRWKEPTGLTIAAIDEGWIQIELEQVPSEPDSLVADLMNFTYAGDTDADKLKQEIVQRRAVRLAF